MPRDEIFDFATREALAKTAVGFLIAGLLLYFVAAGIGIEALRDALVDADLGWVAVGCVSTVACLLAWGKSWQVVLETVGIDVPFRRLSVTYFAATFANYVTPLGQAGGEPFIAYVLSRDTEASYEDSLASVVTADLLNLFPFFSFAAVGLSYLLFRATLPTSVEPLAWGLLVMAVGVPAIGLVGWRFRDGVRGGLLWAVTPVVRRTSRYSLAGVRERIDDLYEAFGRIATDKHSLAQAVAFAYVGWVFFALPLYFAGRSLGVAIDPIVILFVVPASTLAGMVPSPGGTGAVEIALAGLVWAIVPGIGYVLAFSIAVVYRLISYWFALVVGGGSALWVVKRT